MSNEILPPLNEKEVIELEMLRLKRERLLLKTKQFGWREWLKPSVLSAILPSFALLLSLFINVQQNQNAKMERALERDKWSEESNLRRVEAARRQSEEQRISTELQEVQKNILADDQAIKVSQQNITMDQTQPTDPDFKRDMDSNTNRLQISTADRDYYVRRRTELESQLNKLITQQRE